VYEAATAEIAIVVLGTLEADVAPILLSDKCLPGMTGLDMIERAIKLVDDCEVILVTAFADKEALMRSVELGVFRCITKPFHIDELLSAVSQAQTQLATRRAARAQTQTLEARNAELERRLKETTRDRPIRSRSAGGLPPGLRILFVDEDALVQRAYRRLFPHQNVQLATSGATALEQVVHERPDLIVCDMHMPEMDGFTFYDKLGEIDPKLAERVVFVSGAEIPLASRGSRIVPKVPVVKKPLAAAELEGTLLALLAS